MNKSYKYRAFISYSHQDKAFAKWLQKGIENYPIPKKLREKYPHLPQDLKRTVFRDDEELTSASVLSDTLCNALEDSECLIVICSPNSVNSRWVEEEIAYFKSIKGEDKIFTIIKSGNPQDVLPKTLGDEPLAVDAQKGKKIALMKMMAVVLAVDFADLWEREKREAKKRVFINTTLVMFFVGILFYSILQYRAISSNKALEYIHTKMSTIDYKLKRDKLSTDEVYILQNTLQELEEMKKIKEDTLKWFGMLKTSVSKKAKIVYDEKGADEALAILESENSLGEDSDYAKKNMLRAKLYIEKNDYEQANHFYEKAVVVDDSYVNVYEYALFLIEENDTKKAKVLLENLKSYDLNMEQKANVLNRLGINYRKLKRLDKAEEAYMEALKLREELAKKNPEKYSIDLAWTYNNLGVLYQKSKELNASEEAHYKAFGLRKNLAKKDPEKYTFHVTCSMHNLGEMYSSMKEINKAESFFKDALKIRRTLVSQNPKKYIPALACTLHELATLYSSTERLEEAQRLYTEALELRRILVWENPQAYSSDLLDTLKGLEILYRKTGEVKKANNLVKEMTHAA